MTVRSRIYSCKFWYVLFYMFQSDLRSSCYILGSTVWFSRNVFLMAIPPIVTFLTFFVDFSSESQGVFGVAGSQPVVPISNFHFGFKALNIFTFRCVRFRTFLKFISVKFHKFSKIYFGKHCFLEHDGDRILILLHFAGKTNLHNFLAWNQAPTSVLANRWNYLKEVYIKTF